MNDVLEELIVVGFSSFSASSPKTERMREENVYLKLNFFMTERRLLWAENCLLSIKRRKGENLLKGWKSPTILFRFLKRFSSAEPYHELFTALAENDGSKIPRSFSHWIKFIRQETFSLFRVYHGFCSNNPQALSDLLIEIIILAPQLFALRFRALRLV